MGCRHLRAFLVPPSTAQEEHLPRHNCFVPLCCGCLAGTRHASLSVDCVPDLQGKSSAVSMLAAVYILAVLMLYQVKYSQSANDYGGGLSGFCRTLKRLCAHFGLQWYVFVSLSLLS
jgi:hypothetical protein